MARHEGDLQAAAEVSLDAAELLRALGRPDPTADRDRQRAIACCLSGAEGWRDAATRLGGAFAAGDGAQGLTTDKDK